jgi:hypothetical protein
VQDSNGEANLAITGPQNGPGITKRCTDMKNSKIIQLD